MERSSRDKPKELKPTSSGEGLEHGAAETSSGLQLLVDLLIQTVRGLMISEQRINDGSSHVFVCCCLPPRGFGSRTMVRITA